MRIAPYPRVPAYEAVATCLGHMLPRNWFLVVTP